MNPSQPEPTGVSRADKESRLAQRGRAVWLYGLPGSGKSTLAAALEARLAALGRATALLDGDAVRAGLSRGLGFGERDRTENLRRAAEAARILVGSGLVAVCAFITPLAEQRRMVRGVIGDGDLLLAYLSAGPEACAARDPKGLYARARAGGLPGFTGVGSGFEAPGPGEHPLVLDTGREGVDACLERLLSAVLPRIRL